MSYKENLQSNNSDLQTLINTIKNMGGGISLTQTTFSFANSNKLDNKSRIIDNNIDLQGLLLMANNLQVLKLAIPVQSGNLTYNGSTLSPTWTGYNSSTMTISGTTSATNAGTYTATFTPAAGYRWSDGTSGSKDVTWTIGKAAGSLSISKTSITLNSSTTSATFTVTRTGNGTITVTSSNTSVATATLSGTTVTVKSVNNTTGSATITVKVAAGTNHTAPSDKTCSVTATFSVAPQKYTSLTDSDLPTSGVRCANAGLNGMLIFAGGNTYPTATQAYNSSLTKVSCGSLSAGRNRMAGVSNSTYAIFAAGYDSGYNYYSNVEAFNSSGTRSTASALRVTASYKTNNTGVASTNNYAFFGGFTDGETDTTYKYVDAYNTSLTKSTCTNLSGYGHESAGAVVKSSQIAMFAGGTVLGQTSRSTTVDTYTSSLTKSTGTALTQTRIVARGGSTNNYAFFIGGADPSDNYSNTIFVYNSSATRTTTLTLPEVKAFPQTATVNDYLFIFGGENDNGNLSSVQVITPSLVLSTLTSMSSARAWSNIVAGSVGNYAICAGTSTTIDVYTAA